ncbi:Peptidase S1 and S6 chymotrypsin/Hap OS=Tsukamurella paurometabola (strain ATCC 8368 / DSM /CCUG 35730 / CIP 100753 / JCM 10117 / KCTC 9821 / NBRC 16120/ NCIMB 702349 / NCTC 13040) OX=521096 GN=Tpau_3387 PE=4 SV=1 [Tsukamurella paurometabola]|uniref:Peptidase S1 and S6 chymotrypsin/Hap n=1 Tax=Tsukamurella paurometabola (strain ATCC 8368 / DSM 20162 / CCUG 35730 / CIP 100753 / JCM 10117 / KCTC 9821 / NBRC 16120 / NCIMB 702349 / NCTC 13040) TaxID=521096 RepID=D5UWH2_TSUPD|nr:S1 family peptidase [Tsukamurella paurometabola]ADG79971.1 hypothetical protein Tpau_3387 [Tsukamurella paurometabola DSM 20162]SUP37871.1 Uncharacterised protein [Tsukamurella paurometabola]
MQFSVARRLGVVAAASLGAATSVLIAAGPVAAAPNIVIGPGSEIDVVQKETDKGIEVQACTLGVMALTPDGRRVGVTAGHCGNAGQTVAVPVPGRDRTIADVGKVERSASPRISDDDRVIDPNEPDWATLAFKPGVPLTNRQGTVNPRIVGRAVVGDQVCRQGRTTGWQCGRVIDVAGNRILSDVRSDHGDSGGPLIRMADGAVLGIATSSFKDGSSAGQSQYLDLGFIFGAAGGLRLAV